MASVSSDPNGRKRIQFFGADGKRRTIRLGKMPMKLADVWRVKVENLVASGYSGGVDDETARWVAALPDAAHAKLSAVGLVKERESMRLQPFIDRYIAQRGDVKAGTLIVYGHTRRNLIEFFGADRMLREITAGDADEWRLNLLKPGTGLCEATVRRRCGIAKQFFRAAQRKRLIESNPFADLQSGSMASEKDRIFFITREMAAKVLDRCPTTEWKLMFALSRFGGLRCPSEHRALKWADIDFHNGRIRVPSPKTEHHKGKEERTIPMFPELRPLLEQALGDQQVAGDGSEYVITRCRDAGVNLRTQLRRIIRRAGLEPWPKLWHNLRATRQTELAETYPIHVVCAWIGNTQAIAAKHYLQVTGEHFTQALEAAQKAAHSGNQPGPATTKSEGDALCGAAKGPGITGAEAESEGWAIQDSNL